MLFKFILPRNFTIASGDSDFCCWTKSEKKKRFETPLRVKEKNLAPTGPQTCKPFPEAKKRGVSWATNKEPYDIPLNPGCLIGILDPYNGSL